MAIALAVGLGGCGRSNVTSPATNPTSRPTATAEVVRAGAPGSVVFQQGSAVPLGLSQQQVERRLGSPAVPLHRKDANYDCMFYDIVGQPTTVQLQYCFNGGRLKVLASYISR
jgi:hypothetical protein